MSFITNQILSIINFSLLSLFGEKFIQTKMLLVIIFNDKPPQSDIYRLFFSALDVAGHIRHCCDYLATRISYFVAINFSERVPRSQVLAMLKTFAIESIKSKDAAGQKNLILRISDLEDAEGHVQMLKAFFETNDHLYVLIPKVATGVFANHAGKSISSIASSSPDQSKTQSDIGFLSLLLDCAWLHEYCDFSLR